MTRQRQRFKTETDTVEIKENFLHYLRTQAPKKAAAIIKSKFPVMLSFTTDPFCQENMQSGITYDVLKILFENRIPVAILTKARPDAKMLGLLLDNRELVSYGITLTYNSVSETNRHERSTHNPAQRYEYLEKLYNAGIKTFISFEPIIDFDIVKTFVTMTKDYTNLYMFGLMSGDNLPDVERAKLYKFVESLKHRANGVPYYVKDSIRRQLSTYDFSGNFGNATLKTIQD